MRPMSDDPATQEPAPQPDDPLVSGPQGAPEGEKPSDQEVLDAVKLLYSGETAASEDLAAAGGVLYAWARAE